MEKANVLNFFVSFWEILILFYVDSLLGVLVEMFVLFQMYRKKESEV